MGSSPVFGSGGGRIWRKRKRRRRQSQRLNVSHAVLNEPRQYGSNPMFVSESSRSTFGPEPTFRNAPNVTPSKVGSPKTQRAVA